MTHLDLQGHRGCRGLMPENTIEAMLYALNFPISTLELDVVISRDGLVVVSHEPWMNPEIARAPDGKRIDPAGERSYNLFHMDYAEIRRFDVGIQAHPRFPHQRKLKAHKPLLSDLIDAVEEECRQRNKAIFYNIEMKSGPEGDLLFHPDPQTFVRLVMKVIAEKGIGNRVLLQSFDIRPLQCLHQNDPEIKTGLLIEEGDPTLPEKQLEKLGFTPAFYNPHFSLVTTSLVRWCHQQGMRVIPWTVNDPDLMKGLIRLGVDGLISDYPNLYEKLDDA